jgi:transmembrane sensor
MSTPETSRERAEAAAGWAVRLDSGTSSADDLKRCDEWLAGDPRRLGALAQAQAALIHTERARALGASFNPDRFARPIHTDTIIHRRAALVGAVAAAGAGIIFIPRLLMNPKSRLFETKLGETHAVRLEDDSLITLNTASAVAVSYSARRRDIALLHGEGLFDVAKDQGRPFTVTAGLMEVRAIGTSFAVTALPQKPIGVLVREGIIQFNRSNLPESRGLRVPANTRIVAPDDAPLTVMAVSTEDLNRELVWRDGQIAFERSTLSEAAAAFARYSPTRIVIADSWIAQQKITGLFETTDPVAFAKAVSQSLGLHVRVTDREVVLSR